MAWLTPKRKQQFKDGARRAGRTFVQAFVGVFALSYINPLRDLARDFINYGNGGHMPEIDLTFWRNALLACVTAGITAVVTLGMNWLETFKWFPILFQPKDRKIGDQAL